MPLQKQPVNISFSQGLNTKSDPFQLAPGQFLQLENSIFTKAGLLQKRNGFHELPILDTTYKYLTTFNNNLTAIGSSISAYSSSSSSWVTKGSLVPISLSTISAIRSSSNQSQCDAAVSSNGLTCVVYTNTSPSTTYNYVVMDTETGQNIVAPTVIASASESPRVFLLGNYFIVLYSQAANLKYVAIPISNPSSPVAATTLVTNYSAGAAELAFDGVVFNNNLYITYNATDGGGAIRATYLNSFLVLQTASTGTSIAAASSCTIMSICSDSVNSQLWCAFYQSAGTVGKVICFDGNLNIVRASTTFVAAGTLNNVTCTALSGTVTVFYEVATVYAYGASLPTNIISKRTCTTAGTLGTITVVARSVGLASKAFLESSATYMLAAYSSSYQPSYFLIDSSGNVVSKLAYSNGGGYLALGLPSVSLISTKAYIPYLIKDLIVPTNKSQSPGSSTPVYTQTGINLATFEFTPSSVVSSQIGGNLNISGGLIRGYDGYQLVEQGFNVYPDNVIVTTATGAGSITAQDYYYQAVYEWTDNQGNIHRSAPSLPVKITTTTASSTNTIKIPTLRLTAKSLVKIVLYRWSTAQQIYYQVTSISSPTLNDTTVDSVTITDTQADSSIIGNSIIYTTGGVIENVSPPSSSAMTLFKSRLFLIDAEDQNLLWYSKQVIEATPVEMSDLFTLFVAPTISAQGDTGPMKALSAMDDKLIIFKSNAIYYMTGTGPDNTGSNNDFHDPIFITSTIGCSNQNSIVFIPNGLMFQSDKGIWILSRDLTTMYIGAPVEAYNDSTVLSAIAIPGTNQVRFTLSTGEVLMYDYFYNQWGVFTGVPQISSTLYQGLHTFINSYGKVYQEAVGSYLDGSRPVLLKFQTGWLNFAGLQGFERAYYFYLLASYVSPHKLTCSIAYDYNDSPTQVTVITPDNYNGLYGSSTLYGDESPYGGNPRLEQWRIFLSQQKCESFQLTLQESYDASLGAIAGAGFTMSGMNFIVGLKKGYLPVASARSTG